MKIDHTEITVKLLNEFTSKYLQENAELIQATIEATEEALSINNVMQAKPEKTKMKHCLLCEGKGHYYSPSLLRVVRCCEI
ncbi:hypothetical protein LX95_01289 [Mesonia algae]|uniref:Uncharacterized protein n=1 Tax=Mesonia algae TaxID=213248 RepID=A0A2W7I603_9FLAO|nr:hypothetical protein [Mesonia algae]PZW41608.1 hypothetical protein LX95_01289 [Mesonia algae]